MQTIELKIDISCPDDSKLLEKYKNYMIRELMDKINDVIDEANEEDSEIDIVTNVGYQMRGTKG